LYGGRARLLLPANMPQYKQKQGNPETQLGLSAIYMVHKGFGFTFKGNYLSSTCSGRLCLVKLPQSHVYDAGLFWESRDWNLKFDVFNITDERYFRARTGDTLGDVIAQVMPGRRWQLTAKYKFRSAVK
jgi:outer membrane receptor protein involved in Fe transport